MSRAWWMRKASLCRRRAIRRISRVRLNFDTPLPKGQAVLGDVFLRRPSHGGRRIAGLRASNSPPSIPIMPIFCIRRAGFPVSGYTTDRFGADMRITVPMGFTVLGSGLDSHQTQGDKNRLRVQIRASFFSRQYRRCETAARQYPIRGRTLGRLFPGRRGRNGAGLWRRNRQADGILHQPLRFASVFQFDSHGDRSGRAYRLRGAGHDLFRAGHYRQPRQLEGHLERRGPPVVGIPGFAHHPQSSVG